MSGYDSSTKRRRTGATSDLDWAPQPTTARSKAVQRNQLEHHHRHYAQQQQYHQGYYHEQPQPRQPILSLASLPPAALQRYLSRYGLLTPALSLSYHHAVFPVPPLPSTLHPPLDRDSRSLHYRTAKTTYVPAWRNARIEAAQQAVAAAEGAEGGEGQGEGLSVEAGADKGKGKEPEGEGDKKDASASATDEAKPGDRTASLKRKWVEPRMPEFTGLSAFDPPEKVLERLAAKATAHWEKRDTIKEAETLTNFMFSCRSRGHTLRATPAG
ncbi:hypothetical protein JCM8097_005618 [Rhodosporidiobolus ruineniae]